MDAIASAAARAAARLSFDAHAWRDGGLGGVFCAAMSRTWALWRWQRGKAYNGPIARWKNVFVIGAGAAAAQFCIATLHRRPASLSRRQTAKAASAALTAAQSDLMAAEEKWLAVEILREEIEGD